MPFVFRGNINGEVSSTVYNLPFKIKFFTVANKNGGQVNINIWIKNNSEQLSIVPENLSLNDGDMLQGDYAQIFEAGNQIVLSSNGSVDFYFTVENVLPPENVSINIENVLPTPT